MLSMKKPKITIIGAGLAGLAAAYELVKTQKFQVTILEERNRIGGRTHTVAPNGTPIDVGGFIIYPWYETFHRIAKELGCDNAMIPIPKNEIFYNYLNKKKWISEKDVPISLTTKGRIAKKLLPLFLKNLDVANPHITKTTNKTTRVFLDEALPLPGDEPFKTYFDSICQGYCYPSIDEFQLAFLLPMWGNNIFFGDIHSSSYYPQGMQTLHRSLEESIQKQGGTIQTNTKVLAVNKDSVKTTQGTVSTDYSVITHPLHAEVPFTRFLTLTVVCKGKTSINNKEDWGALFLHPDTCHKQNILSIINNHVLYGKKAKNILTLNIKLHAKKELEENTLDKKQVFEELQNIFPKLSSCTITSSTFWNHTMPIANATYITQIKKVQGKNNIFYAGDYLGSPSMETALATGVHAANLIIKKDERNA
jgi:protoporphyrinogen oxidase